MYVWKERRSRSNDGPSCTSIFSSLPPFLSPLPRLPGSLSHLFGLCFFLFLSLVPTLEASNHPFFNLLFALLPRHPLSNLSQISLPLLPMLSRLNVLHRLRNCCENDEQPHLLQLLHQTRLRNFLIDSDSFLRIYPVVSLSPRSPLLLTWFIVLLD